MPDEDLLISDAVSTTAEAAAADAGLAMYKAQQQAEEAAAPKRSRKRAASASKPASKRATQAFKVFLVTHLPPQADAHGFHQTAVVTAADDGAARAIVSENFPEDDLSIVGVIEVDLGTPHCYDMSVNMRNWPPVSSSPAAAAELAVFVAFDWEESLLPSVAVIVAATAEDAEDLLQEEAAKSGIDTAEHEIRHMHITRENSFMILSPGTLRDIE